MSWANITPGKWFVHSYCLTSTVGDLAESVAKNTLQLLYSTLPVIAPIKTRAFSQFAVQRFLKPMVAETSSKMIWRYESSHR